MPDEFQYDVFLSHSSKDKEVVRPLAERLRKDGVKVWFDEWEIKPGDSIPAKIEEGLERSRVLVLCMSAQAFGSDWALLESGTFRFRDPLNKERRFLPLRLDDAPIKGSLAQFLYINWLPSFREQEYGKLREACKARTNGGDSIQGETSAEAIRHVARIVRARMNEWRRMQEDFEIEARKYHEVKVSICTITHDSQPTLDSSSVPNYSINLWQYLGTSDDPTLANRLHSAKFTNWGLSGCFITALGVLEGLQTDLFRKMAIRAGTLLPDEVSRIIAGSVADIIRKELGSGKPVLTSNSNPLAKWLNMMLVATWSSHPERFIGNKLIVDPFAASLSVFDYFAMQLSVDNSVADLIHQQSCPPSLRPIGDAWSGLRGVLEQAYSTKVIKGILGQAGLVVSNVGYTGTFKGPFLDGVDRLVSALDDAARDRFVAGCIEEIVTLERAETPKIVDEAGAPVSQTLQRLQLVLGRFGHDLNTFDPDKL